MSLVGSPVEELDWVSGGESRHAADDFALTASPWPSLALVSAYLYFVLRAGPRFMEKKQPYQLRGVIVLYNLLQVLGSTLFVIRLHMLSRGQFFIAHCRPNAIEAETTKAINQMAFIYFLSKVVELLDTVFFVLRRKMNQVTFLHVYHHTNMVLLTWFFIKVVPGSQLMIIAYGNTSVHVLMYSYYLLAALGPAVQKYLWWKKYLTKIQMMQFLIIIGFMSYLLATPGCQLPKEMIILSICNTTSFLVLFLFFYTREYKEKIVKSK